MNFARYVPPEQGLQRGLPFDELLAMAKDGSIMARAENSGCEGCYVEVARWSEKEQRWERYCFNKVFGGEDLRLEHQTAGYEVGAEATAERIAARINLASGNAYMPLIHRLPNWGGQV
jgi:hypothetical protein